MAHNLHRELRLAESFQIKTEGDLEAILLAESYDLLASVAGPYMYRVSGTSGQQEAIFESREIQALFYIRVNEFLAESSQVPAGVSPTGRMSLFSGGEWLCGRYPEEAKKAGLRDAYDIASQWFSQVHRIVCWSGNIDRHLRLELSMRTLIAVRANLEKHQLFRLDQEIRRLQSKCAQAGCVLSLPETIGAREEFKDHIDGMLEYYATQVAELVGRYFLALYKFVRQRHLANPTNDLRVISSPPDVTDEVFRYMYTGTIEGLSRWSESRFLSSIPETAPAFKGPYRQHADWSIVESEQGAT